MRGKIFFILTILTTLIFFNLPCFANNNWFKIYGTSFREMVNSVSLARTSDGGFIISGESNSKILLMKLDNNGEIQWQKKYSNANEGYGVIQASDGGYLVWGVRWQDGKTDLSYTEMVVIKLNSSGDIQWSLKSNKKSQPLRVIEENDGYLISAIYLDGNQLKGALIKLGLNGSVIWEKSYSKSGIVELFRVSDGYIVTGATNVEFENEELVSAEVLIGKIDFSGNYQWQKKYGLGIGKKIASLQDGNYLIGSYSFFQTGSSSEHQADFTLMKISQDGTPLWIKSYGTEDEDEELTDLLVDADGYVILGIKNSNSDTQTRGVFIKTDFSGNLILQKFIDTGQSSEALSVYESVDNYYILISIGLNNNDIGLIKLNKQGLSDETLCGFLKPLYWTVNTRTISPEIASIIPVTDSTFLMESYSIFTELGDLAIQTFCPTSCTPPFPDVPCDHWAVNNIQWAKDRGITKGYPDGTFRPEWSVKRSEMATFIIRTLEGEPASGSYSSNPYFSDVPTTHWAFRYVQRIKERGIASGYAGTTLYGPEDNVTREQMAKMLIMALVSQGRTTEPPSDYCSTGVPFTDVNAGMWSCRYIKKLKELGITQGCNPPENTRYCPMDNVTRAQMATFLYRAFGR